MSVDLSLPTLADIEAAHERIAPFVHRTPVMTNDSINQMVGAELYFKCSPQYLKFSSESNIQAMIKSNAC